MSNNQMALARLLQPENGPTVLDHACYSQWLHAKDGELDGLHASLQVIRTLVHASDGKYLPLRMKNRGDVRLHIVLALTEAQLCIRLHRHLAATTWHTYARSLMPEIPRFWM
ncbi:hypothetical protein [Alicyclobacillus dauci]|uniref:Uncharacterized protein n=1 Tax=Alicyclobacillus dauci TaxID=1475485 RepID=A0ABY6Z6J6_9BACL|nr:hypothetical protein [Alicyclobacillus dauci]WAH37874.1 hypothetical protein NZD86_05060 [Alicyclobacillus dauci]